MFLYPELNPVALSMGPVKIHWYGIMYLVGFVSGWLLMLWRAKKPNSGWTREQVGDLVFYAALGVIIGGRVGYMLFYNLPGFIHNPLSLFMLWQGGMSFHGGMLGVLLSMWFYGRKINKTFFQITDFIAPVVPLGLAAGRVGNFINGELWGRITNMPWAMIYPKAGPEPRHPSEIYEFLLEGILLFIVLWWFSAKPKPRMAVSGLFLFCYGSFRFFAEFFREPDPQLGYLAWHWLTMGQVLSAPMIIIGLMLLVYAYCKQDKNGMKPAEIRVESETQAENETKLTRKF